MWRWWLVVGGVLVVVQAFLIGSESPYAAWGAYGLYAAFGVALIVRIVQAGRRGAVAAQALAPGAQGLGEVQDLYLGRKPVPPVTYSSAEGTVAELVTERTDPLDERTWTLPSSAPPSSSASPSSAPPSSSASSK